MDADRTFMLFSATFPPFARQLAREYLADDHIKIRVGRMGSTHKNIVQKVRVILMTGRSFLPLTGFVDFVVR